MAKYYYTLFFFFLILNCRDISANQYSLFDKGRTNYSIIVDAKASPSEQFAAKELQFYLKEIGNVNVPIVSGGRGVIGKRIIVGYSNDAKSCKADLKRPDNSDQSYRYFNEGGDIVIVGGSEIGTLYGVYSFLEKALGCRWLTSKVSYIPKKQNWSFSSFDISFSHAFEFRDIYSKDAFDKLWCLRNNNNGRPNVLHTEYGDIKDCLNPFWWVHTFNILVPPSKYYDKHPEYYSLIDGKRDTKQLCLTNKKVEDICVDALREIIKNNPDYKVYDLSQNDNITPCQCRNCKRIKKRFGSESGVIIWFVNKVANRIRKEYPDKIIGTLAYQYSQKPPTAISPEKNVAIRLSVINTCLIHDYESCTKNNSAGRDIEGWSHLTENLFVWDYISTLYIYYVPIPNLEAIQKRLIFYKENGVKGVLFEGNSETEYGEFSALKNYVISKLMRNPYDDLDSMVSDFISHYYGSAAPYIKDYYDLTQSRVKIANNHLFYVMNHKNAIYGSDYLEQAYKLLSLAENKVMNSQDVRERVQYEKLSVAFMLCKVAPKLGVQVGALNFLESFCEQKGIEKFAGFGENVNPKAFFEQMRKYV